MDLRHHDPIPHFVGETWSIKEVGAPKFGRIRGPTELDWHTNLNPLKPVLRVRRLLHPRISSGGILRIQTDWGNTRTYHNHGNGTG